MNFKKIISLLLCAALLSSGLCVNASAESVKVSSECDISDVDIPLEAAAPPAAIGQTLEIKAKSAFLAEPYSGKILYEANADEKLPPASITKIMSLLLVTEALDRKELKLTQKLSASEHACSMGGSQIWLEPGETMTVDELLKAAVIASANDATVVMGEAIAGSEEGFVALMNRRAEELGMNSTHFVNCTGLDAEGHLTTAHDIGIMASELIKHKIIKNYSTVWMDTLRNGQSELVNTNKLIRFYKGATGLKTGTTSKAGYCLAATAERDGMELVAVILNGESSKERFNGARKLLDFGFANFAYKEIKADLPEDLTFPVKNGTEKKLKVIPGESIKYICPKSEFKDMKQIINTPKSLSAPIKKGDKIGTVKIMSAKEPVGEIPLIASDSIKKLTFFVCFARILKGMFII